MIYTENTLLILSDIVIGVCVFALFVSILINFVESKNKSVKNEKKSIVETGSMTIFFIFFYILIRFNIGEINVHNNIIKNTLIIVGLIMIITGCIINIKGRFNLGENWANQIKIYTNQTFIKTGMYKYVRHPLYTSIMLMFYGASFVHPNFLAFISNTTIFIPFMYFRSKQEETILTKTFKEYKQYKKEVGMFFPKIKQ